MSSLIEKIKCLVNTYEQDKHKFYENLKDGTNKKVKYNTLLWLWNNGYQWTKYEAEQCNNSFMKSFFD